MDFFPPFEEFSKNLIKKRNQVIFTKFSADLDTPVSLMLKLAKSQNNTFLLESVTGGEIKGRFSIIGMRPDLIWRYSGNFPEINRHALKNKEAFEEDKILFLLHLIVLHLAVLIFELFV